MQKTYILDSNVLLGSPDAMFQFEEHDVVIPMTVIEEIDNHKRDQNELGRNARQVSRNLKEIRKLGALNEGIKLPGGGTLRVEVTLERVLARLPLDLDANVADNRILAVALQCKGILITADLNLLVKAEALGVATEEYKHQKVKVDDLYTGASKAVVPSGLIDKIYKIGSLELSEITSLEEDPHPNQCFVLYDEGNSKHSALVRYNTAMKTFYLLPNELKTLGLEPKNSEQRFALDLLLDPDISLVTLIGRAGSGKTLLALAAALHGVMESKMYKKVLLLKPIISMDNKHQLGFLPGTQLEKLQPWVASYMDNVQFIMNGDTKADEPVPAKGKLKKSYDEKNQGKVSWAEELMEHNFLEIGSLEHLRGRSLPNQFILIDEAQQLSVHAIKTIITRAGEGTKIVCIGDIEQIDVPYLDASSNGLTYVADKFKNEAISGHITLNTTVRSELAEIAAKIL